MFQIFWSYSPTKNLDFPLSREICFFCAYTSDDKYTEKEIKIQASPSFWRGIYRKTQYYTTSKAFWQFVTIRWFFLPYISSFCIAADPRMTKGIITTTKKKNKHKKYYCDLLQTTTKQCNHSLYSIMQIHFKTTGTPGCLPHRHSGRRRKELDGISIGAAKLKKNIHVGVLLSFTRRRMQINTAHTGHRNTSCLSTYTHIQRFDIFQACKEDKKQPCNPLWTGANFLTSMGVMNFCCIKWAIFWRPPSKSHWQTSQNAELSELNYSAKMHSNAFLNVWFTCYHKEQVVIDYFYGVRK